jgi:two-component system, chemotaxis family, protein-glutamate methylesterase/glutaminase
MAFRFVAVGTSLGGFHALKTVLGALSKDFPLPIAVVQHRSSDDSEALAPLLAVEISLPVVEVNDKELIKDGHIYICPPNYHLLIDEQHFALSTDAPVLHARPSIDVFFQSAAESFGSGVIGVLLTGMSKDGTLGLTKIKECGGYAIVQDPAGAEGQIMPQTAVASVEVDRVLSLEDIGPALSQLCADQRMPA